MLALTACAAGHPQSTLSTDGSAAREILALFRPVFWLALGVFVIVEGALLYAVIRFRRRPQDGIPLQIHGNTPIEIIWTIVPAVVVVVIATLTFRTQALLVKQPAESLLVRVTAYQWWWEFEYPQYNIITANELHLPAGRDVRFELRSADVIHSFWIPRLSGKTDVVPGHVNSMTFRPDDRPERIMLRGQCAEFCGGTHAMMALWAVVEPPADFEAWVRQQQQPARVPAEVSQGRPAGVAVQTQPSPAATAAAQLPMSLEARGYRLFAEKGCIGCHAINGYPNAVARVGPNLTHVGSRQHIVAGWLENTPENMRRWLRDPGAIKPGNRMAATIKPGTLTEDEIAALSAYLEALK
ncbi:cytochrome c oxidase subunit II [Kallotenue papyrolyticum]|uniref:cytochrome c oxidase subunit II n=1 Tax=Kallotenue papyrolyticum TaxID=1325125 RepID=UPI0004922A53|nr:cytochrome c oxidase subunit II [Kallotenue papyrolyticum]